MRRTRNLWRSGSSLVFLIFALSTLQLRQPTNTPDLFIALIDQF